MKTFWVLQKKKSNENDFKDIDAITSVILKLQPGKMLTSGIPLLQQFVSITLNFNHESLWEQMFDR